MKFETKEDLLEYIRPLKLAAILTDHLCGCCLLKNVEINKTVKITFDDPEIKGLMVPICIHCVPFVTNKEIDDLHMQKQALKLIESGLGELVA